MSHPKPAARLRVEPLEDRTAAALVTPTPPILRDTAVGYATTAGGSVTWNVKFYSTATTFREFTAFAVPNVGVAKPLDTDVHVAVADVTGDGVPDVVASLVKRDPNGPNSFTEPVRVFDGRAVRALPANAGATGTLAPVRSWHPFGKTFTGGRYVSAADFDGDGQADVVASRSAGGTGTVLIYSGADVTGPSAAPAPRAAFEGIDDPNFAFGCHTAAGRVNDDDIPDLVAGAGAFGGPRVAGFDGASIRANWGTAAAPARLFNDFFAFGVFSPQTITAGLHVAVADLDADGDGDVLAGRRRDFPFFEATDGRDLVASFGGTLTQTLYYPLGTSLNVSLHGMRIAVKDLDKDARPDLVISHREGNRVTTVLGKDLVPNSATVPPSGWFNPTPHPDDGVWVG